MERLGRSAQAFDCLLEGLTGGRKQGEDGGDADAVLLNTTQPAETGDPWPDELLRRLEIVARTSSSEISFRE